MVFDPRPAGRPRDPVVDVRVLEAARVVYARHGWAGFTVKAVAAAAGVSRDAVSRRFPERADLLVEALAASGLPMLEPPAGRSLAEWLLDLARGVYRTFTEGTGRAHLRVHFDAVAVPELYRTYRERVLDPAQAVLRERIAESARAEGWVDVDPAAVLEDVLGPTLLLAMTNQVVDAADVSRVATVADRLPAIVDRALAVRAGVSPPR